MTAPRRWSLPAPNEVHVWWIDLRTRPEDSDATLSPDELARAARFHHHIDRIRWTHAHVAVRRILAGYLNLPPHDVSFTPTSIPDNPAIPPSPIAMGEGAGGVRAGTAKPALATDPRLRFNLAHAADRAALAVAWQREVGIDLEPIDAALDLRPLLPIACSPAERARVEALAPPDRVPAFLALWTAKEAYLKAIGRGMLREPRAVEVEFRPSGHAAIHDPYDPSASSRWHVQLLDAGPGWAASLALEGAGLEPHAFRWPDPSDAPP